MTEFKKITDELAPIYWDGPSNYVARQYAFLQRGFSLVNEAKNYFLIIFGAALTNKVATFFGIQFASYWFLLAGIVGLPALIVVGRWHLYKASKSVEFISSRHGSVTGYNGYNMIVRQIEQNDEIIGQNKQIIELLTKSNGIRKRR